MSVVQLNPSLQMLSLMQHEPQSQMSVVQGLPSSQLTGVTWQTPATHCSFWVQKLVSAQSASMTHAGGVYVTVRRGRWAVGAESSRDTKFTCRLVAVSDWSLISQPGSFAQRFTAACTSVVTLKLL